jgi:hypothetical protein
MATDQKVSGRRLEMVVTVPEDLSDDLMEPQMHFHSADRVLQF